MANPNIVSVTSIIGKTDYLTPSGTSAVSLLPNSATGHVYKIESLVVANTTSSAANVSVTYYAGAAVTQGSALSGGTSYPICSTVSVPAYASLVVIEKTNGIYMPETNTIGVTSGTGSALKIGRAHV